MDDADVERQIDEHIDKLIATKLKEDRENEAQHGGETGGTTGPQLPPERLIHRGKTVEDVIADLNKSPLFMTDMEAATAGGQVEDNNDLLALQALAYEGSPLENALGFKESGNECFKGRMYGDAREFYGKGIVILAAEERKREKRTQGNEAVSGKDEDKVDDNKDEDEEAEEIQQERQTLETMYSNRAACHLELSNYRSCWLDCAAALRLNPSNVKAYYRSGKALLAVDRIQEADDACTRGQALDPQSKALAHLASLIAQRSSFLAERKRKDDERKAAKARRADLLRAAIAARGIVMRKTPDPPEMEDARVRLAPDEDDPTSELVFPTMLLYPLRMESDFIQEFAETHTLEQHLEYILPPPWDQQDGDQQPQYTLPNVVCYVETKDGGLIKMGKRVTLLKVLAGGKVIVFDQVVRIFVLPADQAEAWALDFKAKRAAEKKTSS